MVLAADTILASLPPALAVTWVIADAAAGLLAADRLPQKAAHNLPIAGQLETAAFTLPLVDLRQSRTPVIRCSQFGDVSAAPTHRVPLVNLQQLCRAGLKFTSSLPKS